MTRIPKPDLWLKLSKRGYKMSEIPRRIGSGVNRGIHEFEPLSSKVIAAALAVHRALGPGFLESIYQNAMCVALTNRSIGFETQRAVPVDFEGAVVGFHKLDLIAGKEIVVELKAVKEIVEVHRNQLLSYLKAANLGVGLLINFNSSPLFIKRVVN